MPFKKGETPKGAKPFKKGQSGNPKGRPKEIPDLKEVLNEVLGDEKDGITAIFMKLRQTAMQNNMTGIRAAELLIERAYGKVKQDVKLDGEISLPTIIVQSQQAAENLKKLSE